MYRVCGSLHLEEVRRSCGWVGQPQPSTKVLGVEWRRSVGARRSGIAQFKRRPVRPTACGCWVCRVCVRPCGRQRRGLAAARWCTPRVGRRASPARRAMPPKREGAPHQMYKRTCLIAIINHSRQDASHSLRKASHEAPPSAPAVLRPNTSPPICIWPSRSRRPSSRRGSRPPSDARDWRRGAAPPP